MNDRRRALFSVAPLPAALALTFFRGRTRTRLNRFFSASTTLATFLSSLLLLLVLAGTNGTDRELRTRISGLDGHILIVQTRRDQLICDPDKIETALRAVPSVAAAAPSVWVDVQLVTVNGDAVPARIKGVIPEMERRVTNIDDFLTSHDLAGILKNSGGAGNFPVILGSKVASRLAAPAGSHLTIVKPGIAHHFEGFVASTFDSGSALRDSELAYATIEVVQAIRGTSQDCVNAVAVRTKDPLNSIAVAETISRILGPGYTATDWSSLYPQFRDAINVLRAWILGLNCVLFLFSIMFSAGALLMVTYQRRRELAVLLTMGMDVSRVRLALALVGMLMGMTGALMAILFSQPLCLLMNVRHVVRLPDTAAGLSYVPFISTGSHLLLVGLLQVVVPTAVGWWVAGDLKRIELIEVLRDE